MDFESPQKMTTPSRPQDAGNPALRMMGIPRIHRRLPSRNWMIFWSILGSFTAAVIYDRHQKRRIQQKWCNAVAHIADETLSTQQMPRRITVFLQASPGDYISSAREHFQEYVKPILVAAAVDWDVIEGRKEDDIRYRVAEKIRAARKTSEIQLHGNTVNSGVEGAIQAVRQKGGVRESRERGGDLVLGRHAWKEYVRGFHEGWLGPLESSNDYKDQELETTQVSTEARVDAEQASPTKTQTKDPNASEESDTGSQPKDSQGSNSDYTASKIRQPYILPSEYTTAVLPESIPPMFEPSIAVSFPHLLGFLNTPFRVWRFLNRRRVAEDTGANIVAFLVAPQESVRSFKQSSNNAVTSWDDRAVSSFKLNGENSENTVPGELQSMLLIEERDWHKSARAPNAEGEMRLRPWQERIVVDERIAQRMRTIDKLNFDNAGFSSSVINATTAESDVSDSLDSISNKYEAPKGVDWKGTVDRKEIVTWSTWLSSFRLSKSQSKTQPWQQGLQNEPDV